MSRTGPHSNLVRPLLSRLRADARWACYAFGTQRALQRNRRNICRSRCRQNEDGHFCRKKMPHSFRCWNVPQANLGPAFWDHQVYPTDHKMGIMRKAQQRSLIFLAVVMVFSTVMETLMIRRGSDRRIFGAPLVFWLMW